jgi:hypothetical protein
MGDKRAGMGWLGKNAAHTLVNGLLPAGLQSRSLPPEGRNEVREALDTVLRLYEGDKMRLELALHQLDRAAAEIERLQAENALLLRAGGSNAA